MTLTHLKAPNHFENQKLSQRFQKFKRLIEALPQDQLPPQVIQKINQWIEEVNTAPSADKPTRKLIATNERKIIKLLEKEVKIVPKNYYRNLWLAIGMSAFGIPLGTAFSVSIGNMAFIGIGLPVGMAIGMAVGSQMDKKAADEGRQLPIETV